ESPTIVTTGLANISIQFDYLEMGDLTNDNATLWFSDDNGANWSQLLDLPKTPSALCVVAEWDTFALSLPGSADNNTGIKIGFEWVNNGDGVGTAPSFAVDNIRLFGVPQVAPVAGFTQNQTTLCNNDCVQYTDTTAGFADTYQWTFQGGNPAMDNTATPPCVFYNTPGTYDVTLVTCNGTLCDTVVMVNHINVLNCPVPNANFSASSRTLCPNECIVFTNLSSGNPTNFVWSFPGADTTFSNDPNPVNICYSNPGEYDVQLIVSNVNGSDTLTRFGYIVVDSCLPPVSRFELESDTICQFTCVQFFNTSLRADSLEWKFPGADTLFDSTEVENPVVCYSDTGRFSVSLQTWNEFSGDIAFIQETVTVGPVPVVVAGDDQTIFIGTETDPFGRDFETEITAFGTGEQYNWFPPDGLSCTTCQTLIANPRESTRYYVTNTNVFGCSATDSLAVFVDERYFAGIPNIFSPNGDNNNDILYVRGNGIGRIEYTIFNRYGQKVFETRDPREGWDGTHRGQEVSPGVFTYFVQLTFLNGSSQELRGNVTMVR
ncbi:MAG: PKD domain-containing protein, partial [Bacteroidota bacterium]